jgi:hypothetical protein
MAGIITPETVTLEIEGVLTTSLVAKVALPYAGTITGAYANVSTAPTGSALNFRLVKGLVNAGVFSIAIGAQNDEATLTDANCKFAKGEIIAVTIQQIGSSYAGKDLTVAITVEAASDAGTPLAWASATKLPKDRAQLGVRNPF